MVTPFRIGVPLTGGFQSVPQPPQMPSYVQFRPNYRPRGPRPQMQPQNIVRNLPEDNLLFVGNIDERVPNDLMHAIFDCCGPVEKWQRLQGPDGRLPAFGFVGFKEPEAAILALKSLHEFKIGTKKLNVRPDEKSRQVMFEHVRRERAIQNLPRKKTGSELDVEHEDLPYIAETQERIGEVIRNTHAHLLIDQEEEEEVPEVKTRSKSPSRAEKERRRRHHSRDRDRRRSDSQDKKRKRHRSSSSDSTSTLGRRSPSINRDSDDSDIVKEKKLRKREEKRKEEEYLRLLKKFEERERRQAKLYTKEDEDDLAKKKNLQKEAKKLEQFLEDYNDERDDPKYYRSSSYLKRRKEYDQDREQDRIDREEEAKELENLKESLNLTKEKYKNNTPDIKREPNDDPAFKYSFTTHETKKSEIKLEVTEASTSNNGQEKKMLTTSIQQKVISNVISVFGEEDPDEESTHVIKKKMKKFEITHQERMESLTAEERNKLIKQLVNDIPTDKVDLFAVPIDWDLIDERMITERIQPWIQKKIKDLIGDDEPSLEKFILEKIQQRSSPASVLADLTMIFDQEAENFVVKLWRFIIYQSKAKKMGLNVSKTM